MTAMVLKENCRLIKLYDYQEEALSKLKTGAILCGGVGSGKSLTALAYYYIKVCHGDLNKPFSMKAPKDLYIITTARKRDTNEWDQECHGFDLSRDKKGQRVKLVIDSWNNIKKYTEIQNAFFIFDEQRVVGSGAWVKAFLKITKCNEWILLSATPGDTWLDYVPVFIANGFYKNKTEFTMRHVVYSRFAKFPKVDRYIEEGRLLRLRKSILIEMNYHKKTVSHNETIMVSYDRLLYKQIMKDRWNIFENKPITNISELCYLIRKVVNSDPSRSEKIKELVQCHGKVIVFYNFDYELEILKNIEYGEEYKVAEWNGHKHEDLPSSDKWVYLVQYTAGAEGWNCIETNAMVFYSQNYSYKILHQSSGRIDRLNTPYKDLYYYHLRSSAPIDLAISMALRKKKKFNESSFIRS